jgi:hypothetical protein
MRDYLTKATNEGRTAANAMAAAKKRFFFLESEKQEVKPRRKQKQARSVESVPEDVVLRMKEHWRRFLPTKHAHLEENGRLDREAVRAALQARDAYLKTAACQGRPEKAWEEVRKAYRFLPEADGPANAVRLEDWERAEAESASIESTVDEEINGMRKSSEEILDWLEGGGTNDGIEDREKNEEGAAAGESNTEDTIEERGRPVTVIELTEQGEALIANVFQKHAKLVKAQMRVLDGREQQTVSRLCEKLRRGEVMKFVRELMMEEGSEQ